MKQDMNDNKLTTKEFDCVCQIVEALSSYISEFNCSNTDNKELLKALKPIEEAHRILEEIIDENCPLMYGPPEVMFSQKELAEMRLREEVIQQVERAELDAEEWKNLMVEIVSSDESEKDMLAMKKKSNKPHIPVSPASQIVIIII